MGRRLGKAAKAAAAFAAQGALLMSVWLFGSLDAGTRVCAFGVPPPH